MATVREMLRNDPSLVGERDADYGSTPLHWASKGGSVELVTLLLEAGAEIEAVDSTGRTALQWALQRDEAKHRGAIRLLMSRGAAHPLDAAIKRGDAQLVSRWLERTSVHHPVLANMSMLALACTHGDTEVVSTLLDAGAAPDGESFDETSPLVCAIRARRADVVQLLLDHGAAAEGRDSVDVAPLDAIGEVLRYHRESGEIGSSLLAHGARPTPQWAVVLDDSAILADALATGIAVNRRDHQGRTALWLAAERVRTAMTRALLDADADPDIPDDRGRTPLHVAVDFAFMMDNAPRTEIARWLLASGADPNARDVQGRTPLHAALSNMRSFGVNIDAVTLLLAAGGDPEIADADGVLPVDMPGELYVDVASDGREVVKRMREMIARVTALLHDAQNTKR